MGREGKAEMEGWDWSKEGEVAELSWPTRVLLGAGVLQRLPDELARLGVRRPLVVTDGGVVKAGLSSRISQVLRAADLPCVLFEGVQPNPTEGDVEEALRTYRAEHCDGLIALGGGSPMDAAKLVQLTSVHDGPLSRFDDAAGGDRFITGPLPPLIAIPTTAGTGSEVGRSGVVTLRQTGRKTVIFSPLLLPRTALCDPELTVGLPAGPTAATGLDALTHALEAFVATGFHPLADAVALDGMRRVARSLPSAVEQGSDLRARTDMMMAAMEGAMAFQKGLGAAHALAHALTPISGLHHGLANALVLPAVMAWNLSAAEGRFAQVALVLGAAPDADTAALAAAIGGAGPGADPPGGLAPALAGGRGARGRSPAHRRAGLRGREPPHEPASVHRSGPAGAGAPLVLSRAGVPARVGVPPAPGVGCTATGAEGRRPIDGSDIRSASACCAGFARLGLASAVAYRQELEADPHELEVLRAALSREHLPPVEGCAGLRRAHGGMAARPRRPCAEPAARVADLEHGVCVG